MERFKADGLEHKLGEAVTAAIFGVADEISLAPQMQSLLEAAVNAAIAADATDPVKFIVDQLTRNGPLDEHVTTLVSHLQAIRPKVAPTRICVLSWITRHSLL